MRKLIQAKAVVAASLLFVTAGAAKPLTYALPDETAVFRPGPGSDVAQNNCLACHSADYVNTQPPNRGAVFWEAEVKKMIKAYHASISEADAKTIVDYLARTY